MAIARWFASDSAVGNAHQLFLVICQRSVARQSGRVCKRVNCCGDVARAFVAELRVFAGITIRGKTLGAQAILSGFGSRRNHDRMTLFETNSIEREYRLRLRTQWRIFGSGKC